MKNEVFTGGSYGFSTEALERLLKDTFPPHMTMDCPTSYSTKSVSVIPLVVLFYAVQGRASSKRPDVYIGRKASLYTLKSCPSVCSVCIVCLVYT